MDELDRLAGNTALGVDLVGGEFESFQLTPLLAPPPDSSTTSAIRTSFAAAGAVATTATARIDAADSSPNCGMFLPSTFWFLSRNFQRSAGCVKYQNGSKT
jgi:hypothetical protein